MPSKFRQPRFEVRSDKDDRDKARIIKSGEFHQPVIGSFEVEDLKAAGSAAGKSAGYAAGKSAARGRTEFSAPAPASASAPVSVPASDLGKGPRARSTSFAAGANQRDSRFVMSQFTRDALFVTAEENRQIEERVRSQVSALAESERVRAREQGFEEGQRQGYQDAFARLSREGRERIEHFEKLLTEIEGAKAELFHQNERFLLELIYRVCRKVLLRELATDRDYLLRLCTALVEKTGLRENLRIRIHPAETETLEMLREGIQERLGALKNLEIEASSSVALGGCVVESDWGAIDARLETQLDEIQAALGGPLAGDPSPPPGHAAPTDPAGPEV